MPANGAGPSRAEALAAAIDGARVALEQHMCDDSDHAASCERPVGRDALVIERPVLRAYRELIAAGELLKSRRPYRPAQKIDLHEAAEPAIEATNTPDDLTRIRGVDATFAQRLGSIGICHFAQIAAWQPEDVPTIAQALDLGRDFARHDVIEQAKMLLVVRSARRAPTAPADRRHSTVATWLPRDSEPIIRVAGTGSALTADDVDALRRELRRGIGRHHLRSLADIAPLMAIAVAIPSDPFDPFESEAEWRPIPLIALPSSQTHDAPTPLAVTVEPRQNAGHLQTAMTALEPAIRVATTSQAHETTVARLDALEAEITALGAEPSVIPSPTVEPEPVTVATKPQFQMRATIVPAVVAVATAPREASASQADTEEADVTITIHRGKLPAVAAMPELPLRPKRTIQPDDTTLAKPVPNTEVSEAAVVIVKRRAAERAAPDLEFYKVPGSNGEPGPVRRLLRAAKVL